MNRGERRFRTARKARRQLNLRLRTKWVTRLEWGYFKKAKAFACRCRKHGRSCSPKVVASMCHYTGTGYHPSVHDRQAARVECSAGYLEYLEAP